MDKKAGVVQLTELKQRHCGACMQAGDTDKKQFKDKGQEREDRGVKQRDRF